MIGEKIKNLRIENNLLQKSLANQLNLSQQSISLYESGNREPDYETLIKIADFFNVSTDFLIRENYIETTKSGIEKQSSEPIADLVKNIHLLLNKSKITLDGKILDSESKFILTKSFSNSIELVRSFEKYKYKDKESK